MAVLDKLREICAVRAERDCRLRITYTDDQSIVVDFRPLIQQGGVFSPLADPSFFSRATVSVRGRAVCWPPNLEFCADALWLGAQGSGEIA